MKNSTAYLLGIGSILGAAKLLDLASKDPVDDAGELEDDISVEDTDDGFKFTMHVSDPNPKDMDILTNPDDESSKKVIMDMDDAKNLMTMINVLHIHDSFEESQLEDKYWETYNKLVDLLQEKGE